MTAVTELVTAVEARYSSQTLIGLTAWDDASAVAVDTTRLTNAATDAIAKFTSRQITYDKDQAEHVDIGVTLVKAILQKRQGGVAPPEVQEDYKEAIEAIDRMREKVSQKLGNKRGWASYTSTANDHGSRFPNRVMDVVRTPPRNPRNL